MIITGIIAEFNPFHNGHAYLLQEARRRTGADFLVVVMSGDFVQRGEPAIINKYTRTHMALSCGADMVLELPIAASTGSAEFFAHGAVSLLNALGCVSFLCFGSECGDIELLKHTAQLLNNEPAAYRAALHRFLASGMAFPAARQKALEISFPGTDYAALLQAPNNILGISYLQALSRLCSDIQPVTISRIGNGYHDAQLQGVYPSATALRSLLGTTRSGNRSDYDPAHLSDSLRQTVPDSARILLLETLKHQPPVLAADFSEMLHYRLLTADTWTDFVSCYDVPEDLSRRIFGLRYAFSDMTSFVSQVKTRNYTEATVRRALLHISTLR